MASLLTYRRGVYSAISEAYGSEVAALEATANDANVLSSLERVTDFVNEAGALMARHGVALRGRRAAELSAREVVELADLALIQSPPGVVGTDHCGAPWAAYRVGHGPVDALTGGAGSALSGALVVAKSNSHTVTNSVGGSASVFTPFAFASANLQTVWGGTLAGPVFAGVSAGVFSDFGSLFFSVGYSGVYAFSARACGLITLVFSLAAPTTLSGWSCASSVTVTARNASGVVVASATQALAAADVGVNKTISLDAGGQSVASVTVSMSLESSWSFPGAAVNVAGFGVNFRRFQIAEVSGSGSAALPSEWLAPIDLAAMERWRFVVAPGVGLKYWSPLTEGVVSLVSPMTEDKTIFADALHLPNILDSDDDLWGWVPVGGDRLIICFGAARVCQIRSDDPRLAALAPGFMAEFVAGVERLREDVPLDVRHLFTSITGTQIAGLGK